MLGQAAGGGGEVPGGDGDGPLQVLQMSKHRNLFSFYTQTDLLFVYQGTCDPVGNWFTVEPRYRSARLVDWAQPLALTLHPDGPLEVKTHLGPRQNLHSRGAVFWTSDDFVGKRVVLVGDLLEFAHLPRGKFLILQVGPVGEDRVTHHLCPCGAYLAAGSWQ